jgi:hypothetical protein
MEYAKNALKFFGFSRFSFGFVSDFFGFPSDFFGFASDFFGFASVFRASFGISGGIGLL